MGKGKSRLSFVSFGLSLLIALSLAAPTVSAAPDSGTALSPVALIASNAAKIARVTGATPSGETLPNPNDTSTAYGLGGTDLGIMWEDSHGKIMTLFGDSFVDWIGSGGGGGGWRSNALAISEDRDLADGMTFSSMITGPDGKFKEIISSAHDTSGNGDFTAIPTAGVSVGSTDYIHYMQIRKWGDAGKWTTNFSEIAYSTDEGQTWTKSGVKWAGNSKFAQAAYVKKDGYVYMFGTPSGRFDNMYLARVPEADMLDKSKYEYWNGSAWIVNDEAAASIVVEAPVGELSVVYNSYYDKFIMTYLNENRYAIVMRSAPRVTGPWSAETEIAKGGEYAQLYGAFIHPWSTSGKDLYFLMSQWGPYNVFLMHSTLNEGTPVENLVQDPGFERQVGPGLSAPWAIEGNGGLDYHPDGIFSRSGDKNAWIRFNSGWQAVTQSINVAAHSKYKLSAFVRTSPNNKDGYFGVRNADGVSVLKDLKFGALNQYTKLSLVFDSGDNTKITIFTGMHTSEDIWVQVDDVSLLPVNTVPPVITLSGDASVEVPLGGTFVDPGATAWDDLEGDISRQIVVSGTVNTSLVGTYTLSYDVTDSDENKAATQTRTVTVTGDRYAVGNVIFKDIDGNVLTSMPRGGFVQAQADIANRSNSALPVMMTVALYNRKGELLNLSSVTKAVGAGATETFGGGFNLPNNAKGNYVEVVVWDSLTGKHPLSNSVKLQ